MKRCSRIFPKICIGLRCFLSPTTHLHCIFAKIIIYWRIAANVKNFDPLKMSLESLQCSIIVGSHSSVNQHGMVVFCYVLRSETESEKIFLLWSSMFQVFFKLKNARKILSKFLKPCQYFL